VLADLIDAVARGRLALAEVGGITPAELDALYELAAARLDVGRNREAADILAGLLTLFPYAARAWRAYGVALHRLLEIEPARRAYDAALLLDPDELTARCYRGEVLLYLGEKAAARVDLELAARSSDPTLRRRAVELLALLGPLDRWEPPRPASTPAPAPVDRFVMPDQTPLPLSPSRFTDAEPTEITQVLRREVTAVFAPAEPTSSAPPAAPARHDTAITSTAIIRRGPGPRPSRGTSTALIPGRGPHDPSEEVTATSTKAPGAPEPREITHTAIIRHRYGLPVGEDD